MIRVLKDIVKMLLYATIGFLLCSVGQSFDSLIIFSLGVALIAYAPYKHLSKYGENNKKMYVQRKVG